jgi:hypothetical protein
MTIKAQLLAVVNRLGYVEKKLMMILKKQQLLERVIYEEAKEQSHQRNWSLSFTRSVMWSRFKDAGDTREAEAAFVLIQREEERKGVKDPIFTEW